MTITININDRELQDCKRAYELFISATGGKITFDDYVKVTYEIGGYNRINQDIEVYTE